MSLEKLITQFESNNSMFLYQYKDDFVGYFSLSINNDSVELNNLAVLPK